MNKPPKADKARFSTKGRIVIPQWLREKYEIVDGTLARVKATPEGILITPITTKYIHSLRGSLQGSGALESLMEERARERDL
jgi:bifunctional DNA-binding transcriptional regulator/antitoxin component of YhaV-PrlF toxin-antitoxin module